MLSNEQKIKPLLESIKKNKNTLVKRYITPYRFYHHTSPQVIQYIKSKKDDKDKKLDNIELVIKQIKLSKQLNNINEDRIIFKEDILWLIKYYKSKHKNISEEEIIKQIEEKYNG